MVSLKPFAPINNHLATHTQQLDKVINMKPTTTLNKPKGLMSVSTKLPVPTNSKLEGEPRS